jgi:hypothetical protein
MGIDFLTSLYYEENVDRRYSALNTAASALSSGLQTSNGKTFGHEKVVLDL